MKLRMWVRVEVNDKWAANLSTSEIQERVAAALNAGRRFPLEGPFKVKIVRKLT